MRASPAAHPSPCIPITTQGEHRGREGNRARTSAETEGEERHGRGGGGAAAQPEDEGAGGAQPSREAAGARRPPRMPESCSTVTYWAERSRLNQEKRLRARASRHRGRSSPQKRVHIPRRKGSWCCPLLRHWAPGQVSACSASSPPGTGGQDWVQQVKGHPPTLLGTRSAPQSRCHCPRGQSPSRAGEKCSLAWRPGAPASAPCSAAAGQVSQPKRAVGSEHQGTRGGHCSILAAWDAAGNPREQLRACSSASTSSAAGGTASKKER